MAGEKGEKAQSERRILKQTLKGLLLSPWILEDLRKAWPPKVGRGVFCSRPNFSLAHADSKVDSGIYIFHVLMPFGVWYQFLGFLFLYFLWIFVAVHGFSLVAGSRGYSLVEAHGLLLVVASPVVENGLYVRGLQ